MKYLLDTCVVSELMVRSPNIRVLGWFDQTDESRLYLSVITIGEIQKGVAKLPHSARKLALQTWLSEDLLIRFSGRIVALDTETMLLWGQLVGELETKGRPMPVVDSLLASSALHKGCTLVTRNEQDFAPTSVPILNPWQPHPKESS